ncbi:MAG: hypothetical protein CSA33_07575 [Desulfobulbus propionicus]|nr:MAG: hypothetical protein CSA33_07575 [Desulfobulbus propionicus]
MVQLQTDGAGAGIISQSGISYQPGKKNTNDLPRISLQAVYMPLCFSSEDRLNITRQSGKGYYPGYRLFLGIPGYGGDRKRVENSP